MTIEECREKDCVHVSFVRRCRNCGVTDCFAYENYFEERWYEEQAYEFEECDNEND